MTIRLVNVIVKEMNFQVVRTTLLKKGINLFSAQDFINVFALSRELANVKLSRYKKQGYLTSPKKGVYYFSDSPPDNFVLANHIYMPSYVSLETILSREGIIPESVYTITSITTKATREFIDNGIAYSYSRIKKEAYTGYYLENGAQIATPEKALVDYLYFVSQGRKILNDRITFLRINKKECLEYIRLFDNKRLDNLVKKIF